MSERTFESPVFVRAAEGLIQEIACLEDAFDFLDEWPKSLNRNERHGFNALRADG